MTTFPNGKSTVVSLTFDVDAGVRLPRRRPGVRPPPDTLSEGRFGVVRGVPRILACCAARPAGHVLRPGRHGRAPPGCVAVLEAGHEIGHHGYIHLRSDKVSAAAQREEIEQGFAALEAAGRPEAARLPLAPPGS